jgi:long-chain fatty acid transport protein
MRLFSKSCCSIALFLLLLLLPCLTLAGPIDVPMQSSKAAGEADAFTAQADDPSAIYYNPAGLTQLQGTQISAGAYYLQPVFQFHGDDGSAEHMDYPSVLPHVYAETNFGLDRFRFGFGVNDVDGINEDWGPNGPLNEIVNKAELEVINFAPTVAYRVDNHLSLGIAFNIYYGNLDLERNVTLAAPPAPEGDFRVQGHAVSFGVTPGIMYKINDRNQIGLYYRSPFALDFTGHAEIKSSIVPEIGPSPAKDSLQFPQSIGLGYAMRPIDPLRVEADVIWTDWDSVNQLYIRSPNPVFNNQELPADWKSGFAFRLGGQYQLDRNWYLRAGYAFGQNAVPTATFSPLVPDSNYHLAAVGVGYQTDHWGLDLAVNGIFRETRQIANNVYSPAADGKWSNQIYGLMLTYTIKL